MIKIIGSIVGKIKQSTYVRNLFEAPFNTKQFPVFGSFTDSYDNTFSLLQGLRSKIKPGWENMFTSNKTVSGLNLTQLQKNGNYAVQKIVPLIENFGKNISECTILEIGCNTGATAFALAEKGAKKVVGSEFTGYKISSIDQHNITENKLEEVSKELQNVRSELRKNYKKCNNVEFIEDDICNSQLLENSFDIICSWDVLEHLHNTQDAFISMKKLLAPGGLLIHEYNPFFSLNGGHSLCTLDFVWGHTRLHSKDFTRYIQEIRPNELDKALSFYYEGLNRMTISDCTMEICDAGLELISILPYVREPHARIITQEIITQTQRNYPSASILDLVSPRVIVIARKK